MGGEVSASRPICDEGWLPMDRQIGSSGQTVAPKLYLALGISGAIQHVVGMKGSRTIAAINKDQTPPSSKSPTTASSATSSKSFPP
jgi:electron transfer flavoprotein alpha subunit